MTRILGIGRIFLFELAEMFRLMWLATAVAAFLLETGEGVLGGVVDIELDGEGVVGDEGFNGRLLLIARDRNAVVAIDDKVKVANLGQFDRVPADHFIQDIDPDPSFAQIVIERTELAVIIMSPLETTDNLGKRDHVGLFGGWIWLRQVRFDSG
ncbi:MAG TPA: hypothetical protein VLL52_09470 [Anaerolineae bacterium]|nr:hypothetical protein [Anaerolineae bacterium]